MFNVRCWMLNVECGLLKESAAGLPDFLEADLPDTRCLERAALMAARIARRRMENVDTRRARRRRPPAVKIRRAVQGHDRRAHRAGQKCRPGIRPDEQPRGAQHHGAGRQRQCARACATPGAHSRGHGLELRALGRATQQHDRPLPCLTHALKQRDKTLGRPVLGGAFRDWRRSHKRQIGRASCRERV